MFSPLKSITSAAAEQTAGVRKGRELDGVCEAREQVVVWKKFPTATWWKHKEIILMNMKHVKHYLLFIIKQYNGLSF